ncbi:uncharacterized protein EKO05_0003502 [Ascochyta rabiei]|uniref:uncharacterized protein n=1 Tax=Didymella rabiei TaxID=5454 RepID=UPI002202F07F|nr:uncharacterized protein EKO05_0003502 [Ascochyta rabiei]UPX12972.1 hypothetical protein EKO05_0003502 [Ascochyta rabiei]
MTTKAHVMAVTAVNIPADSLLADAWPSLLGGRAWEASCETSAGLHPDLALIRTCQEEAKTPQCWPPNGTRICIPATDVSFSWPPLYYNETSNVYINYNQRGTPNQTLDHASGELLNTTLVTDMGADGIRDRPYEEAVEIIIHEKWRAFDSLQEIVHQGRTLILVAPDGLTQPSATVPPDNDGPKLAPGTIAGIVFGALIGAILLGMLCFSCCGCVCCGNMGEAERKGIRQQQALREQGEMDDAKLEGVVTVPTRAAARPASIRSDAVRAVEEQSVKQQQLKGVGEGVSMPPAHEVPPPKYTP